MGVTDKDIKPLLFMCQDILVSFPSFDRKNGWITTIFQILLIAKSIQCCGSGKYFSANLFSILVWCVNMPLRKLDTNIIDFSFVTLCVCRKFMSFSIYEVMVCSLLCKLLYLFSQFPVSMNIRSFENKNWLNSYRWANTGLQEWPTIGPFMEPCIMLQINSTVQFSICYWNANLSTPVFRSSSIIICN